MLWIMYRERTYPRTKVAGSHIGSVSYDQLARKVDQLQLLPDTLQLHYGDTSVEVSPDDLGVRKDSDRTAKSAQSQKSWLPILNLWRSPELKAPIRFDETQFAAKTGELAQTLRKDPANARLVLNGATVDIRPGTDGFELAQKSLQQAVTTALDAGRKKTTVPTNKTTPKVSADSLKEAQKTLQNQLKTNITYRYNGKVRQASSEDIAKWFTQSGETYTLSREAIQAYITLVGKEFGIRVKDAGTVAASTQQAVSNQKAFDATLVVQTSAKTYTYCVAARGVDAAHLSTLKSKLQSVYNDSRGWSLDGLIEYKEVASGCNFTVWLSAASQMPSFGAICDSMWSCRVGPNVVINFDRWQNASPSWNAGGGSLEDYRAMVINHETGHWLSFGHLHCGGAGQPAPVMQQQSIDLQGCTFNPWPLKSELDSLRRSLGL